MGKLSIYEFKDYKVYLRQWIERTPNKGRGQRKLMAEAIGCQTPFITHVLSGDYHLSLEQAEACARWLGFNDSESEFFVLLVMRQRAGTRGLEAMASRQISKRREAETVLKKRLNIPDEMTLEDQLVYYSNWYYAAIHMACHIPALQNADALRSRLGLSTQEIMAALEFLTEHKLIEQTKNGYRVSRPALHLGRGSLLLPQHHTQWRLRAMESFRKNDPGNLFYSGVASLSREDYEWVRERFAQTLEEAVSRVKESKDETMAAICFDVFEL